MHSEPESYEPGVGELSSDGAAVGGLAQDTVVYPVTALGVALAVGGAAGAPDATVLVVLGVAVCALAVVVTISGDDLVGRTVSRYARGRPDPTARVSAALAAAVIWGSALLVGLTVA